MGYELEVLHPIVHHILYNTGKTYYYECHAPVTGVLDFLVILNRATVIAIECKVDDVSIKSAAAQLNDYVEQFEVLLGPNRKVVPWLVCKNIYNGESAGYCRNQGILLQTPFLNGSDNGEMRVPRGEHKGYGGPYGINQKLWGYFIRGTDENGKKYAQLIGKCVSDSRPSTVKTRFTPFSRHDW